MLLLLYEHWQMYLQQHNNVWMKNLLAIHNITMCLCTNTSSSIVTLTIIFYINDYLLAEIQTTNHVYPRVPMSCPRDLVADGKRNNFTKDVILIKLNIASPAGVCVKERTLIVIIYDQVSVPGLCVCDLRKG